MMFRPVVAVCVFLLFSPISGAVGPDVEYWCGSDNYDRFVVTLTDDATVEEQRAAALFQEYWQECTGHAVAESSHPDAGVVVYIGMTAVPDPVREMVDVRGLTQDAIFLRTFPVTEGGPKSLLLTGGGERGVLFAVYEFFEQAMGMRFLTPADTHVPEQAPEGIFPIDHLHAPQLLRRGMQYEDSGWRHFPEPVRQQAFDAFRLSNEPAFGPGFFVHTTFRLLNPGKYFPSNPEFFSLINGKRTAPVLFEKGEYRFLDLSPREMGALYPDLRSQLCFSNPDVAEALLAELLPRMRAHPDARVWSVSQEDWDYHCQCEACAAINEREESLMGAVLTCINRVADGIREEFPDHFIETLAYTWTRKMPKTLRPRDNVIISLCNIECNMIYAMDDHRAPFNRRFYKDLQEWKTSGAKLFFWDYPENCVNALLPYPNFHILQRNMQSWADSGAIGGYLCGGEPVGIHLSALRAYLLAKLMWDPDCDYESHKREFIALYYGKAAPHIHAYIDLITETALRKDAVVDVHDQGEWIDHVLATAAATILAAAYEAADTPETRARVRILEAAPQFWALFADPEVVVEDHVITVSRPNSIGIDRIIERLHAFGIPEFHGMPFHQAYAGWLAYANAPRRQQSPLLAIENAHNLVWAAPGLCGALVRWKDKNTGLEWFDDPVTQPGTYRWLRYTDYSATGNDPRETCLAPAYTVLDHREDAVTLGVTLANGLQVVRTLALLEDRAGFDLELAVSNPTEGPLRPSIKTHPEFFGQTGTHPDIMLYGDNGWETMNPDRRPYIFSFGQLVSPEKSRRIAARLPEKNVVLVSEWPDGEVSQALVFYMSLPWRNHINIEQIMDDAPLAPGASRRVKVRYYTAQELPPG